jgi:hypothetical protein
MAYIILAWLYCLVISIAATPFEELSADLLRTEREPLNDFVRYEGYWRIRGLLEGSGTVTWYAKDCPR